MSKSPAAAPAQAQPNEELRLLRTYFEVAEQEAASANIRAQVRDRILEMRAEAKGYLAGHEAAASAARVAKPEGTA